jgi:hypothetical protein
MKFFFGGNLHRKHAILPFSNPKEKIGYFFRFGELFF